MFRKSREVCTVSFQRQKISDILFKRQELKKKKFLILDLKTRDMSLTYERAASREGVGRRAKRETALVSNKGWMPGTLVTK